MSYTEVPMHAVVHYYPAAPVGVILRSTRELFVRQLGEFYAVSGDPWTFAEGGNTVEGFAYAYPLAHNVGESAVERRFAAIDVEHNDIIRVDGLLYRVVVALSVMTLVRWHEQYKMGQT